MIDELFLIHFSSVYSIQYVVFYIVSSGISAFDLFFNVTFSVNNVYEKLSNLHGVKSIGPDEFSGDFLSPMVCYLFSTLFIIQTFA